MGKIFDPALVEATALELKITNLAKATIGEVAMLAHTLEQQTGVPFIRMDQGVPGFAPCSIGLEAEKKALDSGVAAIYPAPGGVGELKTEASRFIKAFMDVEVSATCCIPVTGSVAGSFGAFIATSQCTEGKNKVLFIDPGFPIQKSQLRVLGIEWEAFDIFDHRGEALAQKLESFLAQGDICSIIYSNPNNPAWICLTESELKTIGELATKHDVVVIEDLAYFDMDFRKPLGRPYTPPFQATVARYTDNYILMISGSKIFSYAGQRTAITAVSDTLYSRVYSGLTTRYGGTGHFGNTYVNSILYMITSGATHTTQYGLAAMFRAATDGEFSFVDSTREYAVRAGRMKQIFEQNGFFVVYDNDLGESISDGFFFTIGYPNMTSGELMRELIYYGISSITLLTTGSDQQGIRACTSRMKEERFPVLEQRLKMFAQDNNKK